MFILFHWVHRNKSKGSSSSHESSLYSQTWRLLWELLTNSVRHLELPRQEHLVNTSIKQTEPVAKSSGGARQIQYVPSWKFMTSARLSKNKANCFLKAILHYCMCVCYVWPLNNCCECGVFNSRLKRVCMCVCVCTCVCMQGVCVCEWSQGTETHLKHHIL